MIDGSLTHAAFEPGLQVPSPYDQIILLAYHFYNHYRLPPLADVSFTRGALPRQTGVLKYLADLYASINVYCSNLSDWDLLIERAIHIQAREFLTYGLFFLETFYGRGTVPEDILDRLLNRKKISIPVMGNAVVRVDNINQLLDYEIRTLGCTVGPTIRMFNAQKVPGLLIGGLRDWKSEGNDNQGARCVRVENLNSEGLPVDSEWEFADELTIDETKVDPRQYFRTHLTGGVWPSKGGVRAYLLPLWDDTNLFLQADVYAGRFSLCPSERTSCMEKVYASSFPT